MSCDEEHKQCLRDHDARLLQVIADHPDASINEHAKLANVTARTVSNMRAWMHNPEAMHSCRDQKLQDGAITLAYAQRLLRSEMVVVWEILNRLGPDDQEQAKQLIIKELKL